MNHQNQLPLSRAPYRISLAVRRFMVLVLLFSALPAFPLSQIGATPVAQDGTAFSIAFHRLQELWQHGTAMERKKAAADLIAEADKLPDSNSEKARALFKASAVYSDDPPREIALLKRALAIDEKSRGADDPLVAWDLRDLAVLSERTDMAAAERLYRRAAKIADSAETMWCFGRAMVLANASEFYERQKRYKKAEPLLRRAVEVGAGLPPTQRGYLLTLRAHLADLLRKESKLGEADRLMAEPPPPPASTTAQPEHTEALNDSLRARHEEKQGNMREAELFYRQAISVSEKDPTAGFSLAEYMEELADLCHSEKQDAEAEELYWRALDLRENSITPLTANYALSLSSPFRLQGFLRDQGRLSEIEPVFQRALAIQEQYLGPNDSQLVDTLKNLAEVYREDGKSDAALPLCDRALQISEREFGKDDLHVAGILNVYALNLEIVGRTEEAGAMRTRAEQIQNLKK